MSKKVKYYYDTENLAYRKIKPQKRKSYENLSDWEVPLPQGEQQKVPLR